MHHLHLLGATGTSRTEMYLGREHLVVPVVALMEGVIHAVNAETPEFVPLATLQKAAKTWDGRPVVLGHPTKDGRQCSANSPAVLASHGMGTIFNTRVEGKKLLLEAWVDKIKAKQLHPEMFKRLEANKTEEVSVGAFVLTNDIKGTHNGRQYKAEWAEATGDHLAFLPGGRGACSVEMGCGTHRAAADGSLEFDHTLLILEDDFVDITNCEELLTAGGKGSGNFGHSGRPGERGGSGDGGGDSDRTYEVIRGDGKKVRVSVPGSDGTAPPTKSTRNSDGSYNMMRGDGKMVRVTVPEDDDDGGVTNSAGTRIAPGGRVQVHTETGKVNATVVRIKDRFVTVTRDGGGWSEHLLDTVLPPKRKRRNAEGVEVEMDDDDLVTAKAGYKDCAACKGTGTMNGNPCESCDGRGELKAAAAAAGPLLKAACGCKGEKKMDKTKKAELIAALVTDKHSGFKEGDETFLETLEGARLEEFRAAAVARGEAAEKASKDETDLRNAQAKLKIADEKLRAAEAKPTKEQWLEAAPPEIKALLEKQEADEITKRDGLLKTLKEFGANTEEELTAMPTAQLETLAKYAKVETVDFSGRGVAKTPIKPGKQESLADFAPPNPYAEPIKALQAAAGK